ncbi:hypothetical protein H5410_061468 [Solanum commersonii]|uniref:Uncharacterized protein n=1 Tax=Solanum commersonii TaxID=4109 RepID=A0A9J5W9R7_SOLCO|nr:hypothetical protein H5410_061468 [Solanum commersonii]
MRYNLRNWKKLSYNSVVFKVKTCIRRLVKIAYPMMNQVPTNWTNMVSSYDYCLRNHKGDLIITQGEKIHETTTIEAEAFVIKEAIYHCVPNEPH